jgi:aspartate aminotransferase
MIAPYIKRIMNSKDSSVIRKMFEEGVALKKKYGTEKVFDFSLGNPDLEPPEAVAAAIEKIAADKSTGCHGYMQNAGYPETRTAMAAKETEEQQVPVDMSSIVMTVGAAGALNCVFKAILSPGDEVLVPSPFFSEYVHYIHNHNGEIVPVATKKDFSLDIDKIAAALSEKTAAVLINSPNNPTGKVYTETEISELSRILEENGKKSGRYPYLICDEPYRAITYDGIKVAPVFSRYKSAIIVTSFAKNLSIPGERIGYICVNPFCPDKDEVVAASTFANRVLGFVNAPAFFQKVITASWNSPCDYSSYKRKRDLLMDILDTAGITYASPQGAFYLFCKVPAAWKEDDAAFCNHLKDYLILCAPGNGFGLPGWFRIAYCVNEATITASRSAFFNAVRDTKETEV